MPTKVTGPRAGFNRAQFSALQNLRVQTLAQERPTRNRWYPPDGDYLTELTEVRYGTYIANEEEVCYIGLTHRIADGDYIDQTFDQFVSLSEAGLPFAASAFAVILGENCPDDMLEATEAMQGAPGVFLLTRVQHNRTKPQYAPNIYINERAGTVEDSPEPEPEGEEETQAQLPFPEEPEAPPPAPPRRQRQTTPKATKAAASPAATTRQAQTPALPPQQRAAGTPQRMRNPQ